MFVVAAMASSLVGCGAFAEMFFNRRGENNLKINTIRGASFHFTCSFNPDFHYILQCKLKPNLIYLRIKKRESPW